MRTARPRQGCGPSGGLTLDRADEVALTGVDYISVGVLTHSAVILDIGRGIVGGSRESGIVGGSEGGSV